VCVLPVVVPKCARMWFFFARFLSASEDLFHRVAARAVETPGTWDVESDARSMPGPLFFLGGVCVCAPRGGSQMCPHVVFFCTLFVCF